MKNQNLLDRAVNGDINAFQELYSGFQDSLKSFLYRLLASRADAEDIAHDVFIRAFDKLGQFRGESSLKSWVFQIASNLAKNELKKRKRWVEDVKSQAKQYVHEHPALQKEISLVHQNSDAGAYDIREHIDTCFTCMSKSLPIENQVALILRDVYDFSVSDIQAITEQSEGQVKYQIQKARKILTDIFERRCALVNKKGVCDQCSELNAWFNPKQNLQEARMKIRMYRDNERKDKEELYAMRTELVKAIDPLRSNGNELQEMLLRCNRIVMNET